VKPKEWLKKEGHISEVGRGRLSAAHIALIKEAVSNGVVIEGYSATARPAVTTGKPAAETVTRDVTSTGVVDVPDMVRDPRDWDAYDDTGKIFAIGIKGVCENCRSSVTYCRCTYPVLRVDHDRVSVVTFKPKKGGK
jgi:hypothetical protein